MHSKIVIFTEELSMKSYLDVLLLRILPQDQNFQIVPFEGKSDLDNNLKRKLQNWIDKSAQFIILRDQDGRDCEELKHYLYSLCLEAGREDAVIRIVCNELESWHLADLIAVGKAYGNNKISTHQNKSKAHPELAYVTCKI